MNGSNIIKLDNKLGDDTHFNEILAKAKEEGRVVLLDFYATWCGPCVVFGKYINEIAHLYPEIYFCKLNVDGESYLVDKHKVNSIPRIEFYKDGEHVLADSQSGFERDKLTAILDKYSA